MTQLKERTITIRYRSSVSDELWANMVRGINDTVEQDACDYAAAASDDRYELDVIVGTGSDLK